MGARDDDGAMDIAAKDEAVFKCRARPFPTSERRVRVVALWNHKGGTRIGKV
jgi:hypothetical protein